MLKRFEVTCSWGDSFSDIVDAETRSKARMAMARRLQEVSGDMPMRDILMALRVRRADGALRPEERRRLEAEDACRGWNARHPVGTRVHYWRMDKAGEPSGTGPTRSTAQVNAAGTAVVWITECSGCIALSHVEVAS